MRRNESLFLDDICQAIENIRKYTEGMDFEDFRQDRKTCDAVVRNLEIIGEATGRLSESLKLLAPDIEWKKIVGIRNVLIHEYFGISLPIVWDVVANKLDQLYNACKLLLGNNCADSEHV